MDRVFVLALLVLAIFVAFPIYVLLRLAQLGRAVAGLEREIAGLRAIQRAAGAKPAAPEPLAAATPSAAVSPIQAPAPAVTPPAPPPREGLLREIAAAAPPPPPPPLAAAPPVPSGAGRNLESVLGANWLSKLGIVAIALAAAFFLKYAFESGWIGPTARVATGLVGAVILLGLGQWLLTKPTYRSYAQVLSSGGIIILFLSIYAAYSSYQLIRFEVAFAVLAAAALAASALAVANNTQAVALLCVLGAFATPALIRQGGAGAGDLLHLYAYLAGLNLWSALLVRYRPWHSLSAVSFGATWLLFFGAGDLGGRDSYLVIEGFAVLFLAFACYSGMQSARGLAERSPEMAGLGAALILVACVAFAAASGLILAGIETLGLPALAVIGMMIALLLAGMAVAFPSVPVVGGTVRQFFQYLSAGALALFMAITVGMAPPVTREQVPAAFLFGLFAYLIFLGAALHMRRRSEGAGPAAALVVANGVAQAVVAFHVLAPLRIWGVHAAPLWLPLAGWITLGALWADARQRPAGGYFAAAVMIAAQALPAVALVGALTLVEGWRAGRGMALFFGEFVLVSGTWVGLRRLTCLPHFRGDLLAAFGNAAIFFGLMATAARLQSYQGLVLLCGGAIALAAYHALVGASVPRRDGTALLRLTYLGLALTFLTIAIPLQLRASYLTLAWAVESAILVWTGLTSGERRACWYGVALLFVTAAKSLALDLGSPEPFRLLLNERMLSGASVIAAAYVSAWLLWKRPGAADDRWSPAVLALLANAFTLLFVSLDLWDYLGQRVPADGRENAQQLALSIFWSVYALAVLSVGIWQRGRPLRLFAMGLLYLSILKVFLYDLSFLEQAYRIVSFFGLGVILLLVSLLYTRFEERLK